jgi:hypothetical protein
MSKGFCVMTLFASAVLASPGLAYAEPPVVPSCAVWQACGTWDSWSEGGYDLYNNIWGDGAGPQCIWACSHSNWGIWADHPDTSGVKSYPNSGLPNLGVKPSAIGALIASFDCTVPNAGAYTTTFDIWSGRRTEIMLWMNKQGNHEPWAHAYDSSGKPIPDIANVTVGGHTWNYYWNGGPRGFNVFSMVRTSNATAGTLDLKAILQWLVANTPLDDVTIDKVQFGFEISGSSGGMNFTTNSLDISFTSNDTGVPTAPTGLVASVAGATSVALSWTDNSSNESGFAIERGTDGTTFAEIATVGSNVTSYTSEGLSTGTTYYFRVRAFNTAGNTHSAYSNVAAATPLQLGTGTGLKGDYFDNADLTSLKLTRTDATVNFNWGNGSPDASIGTDSFSVRWTGTIQPLFSEPYTIETFSDDGDRVWINGLLVIDDWKIQRGGSGTHAATVLLTAGVKYPITVEFMENTGGAAMQLLWSSPSQTKEVVPKTQLYPQ